jgi:hypothetical protein
MQLSTPGNIMSNIPINLEVRGAPGTQNLPEEKAPEPIKAKESQSSTVVQPTK